MHLVSFQHCEWRKWSVYSPISQEPGLSISLRPIKYQTQAIQWASRANMDISRVRTTALYWEYLSSFCSSRSNRSSRTVFSRWTPKYCTDRYKLHELPHIISSFRTGCHWIEKDVMLILMDIINIKYSLNPDSFFYVQLFINSFIRKMDIYFILNV